MKLTRLMTSQFLKTICWTRLIFIGPVKFTKADDLPVFKQNWPGFHDQLFQSFNLVN
jgi:hypothetical protein